jgi:2-desacetyl-2-hydroxyethyl bacteriochlorophyllide A dehydrogenase
MKGVVYHGPGDVRVHDDLPMPELRGPRDAVVRVTITAICGTDLHPYRHELPGLPAGTVLGHEFVGTVFAAGAEVPFAVGDRVLASDLVACGRCRNCVLGWHYQCAQATLFGYGTVVGESLPGGQAEYVRVPFADVVLSRIPADVDDEEALFAGDILTTGYAAVEAAGVRPGETVAVIGGGPVGACAAMCAVTAGAARVVVVDPDDGRRAWARSQGWLAAQPDSPEAADADVVLEAVGDAEALRCAVRTAARCGRVVSIGAHHSPDLPFPADIAFARELSLRFVVGDPIRCRDRVLDLVRADRLDPTSLVSHRLPLSAAANGYRLFDRREAVKVLLHVGDR